MINIKKTVFFAILLAGAFSIVSISGETAFAKRKGERPIGKKQAAKKFSSCMGSDDATTKSGRTYDRCCSESRGFCVKCPKDHSTGKKCSKSPYRIFTSTHDKVDQPKDNIKN